LPFIYRAQIEAVLQLLSNNENEVPSNKTLSCIKMY